MIDLRHLLAVLSSRMPWQEIEARVARVFSRKGRAGVARPELDLFGEQVQRTAVGRLQREIERKARALGAIGAAVRQALGQSLDKAARIAAWSGQRKVADGQISAPGMPQRSTASAKARPELGCQCPFCTQFSISSAGTRSNSAVLLVTSTKPSLRAWAAMCRSFTPMGRPSFSRWARMAP